MVPVTPGSLIPDKRRQPPPFVRFALKRLTPGSGDGNCLILTIFFKMSSGFMAMRSANLTALDTTVAIRGSTMLVSRIDPFYFVA